MILNFHVFTSLVHSSVRHSPSRVGVAIKVRTTWRFARTNITPPCSFTDRCRPRVDGLGDNTLFLSMGVISGKRESEPSRADPGGGRRSWKCENADICLASHRASGPDRENIYPAGECKGACRRRGSANNIN